MYRNLLKTKDKLLFIEGYKDRSHGPCDSWLLSNPTFWGINAEGKGLERQGRKENIEGVRGKDCLQWRQS